MFQRCIVESVESIYNNEMHGIWTPVDIWEISIYFHQIV